MNGSAYNITWVEFKKLIDNTNSSICSTQMTDEKYLLWSNIQGLVISCTIEFGSAQDTEYKENYESNANKVSGTNLRFVPFFQCSDAPISLETDVEHTIYEGEFIGKLDEISIRMQEKESTVKLIINDEQIYNLSFSNLKDSYELESTYNSIFVSESGKLFFDQYPFPIDFNKIKITITNNRNGRKDLKSYMIKMRRLQP